MHTDFVRWGTAPATASRASGHLPMSQQMKISRFFAPRAPDQTRNEGCRPNVASRRTSAAQVEGEQAAGRPLLATAAPGAEPSPVPQDTAFDSFAFAAPVVRAPAPPQKRLREAPAHASAPSDGELAREGDDSATMDESGAASTGSALQPGASVEALRNVPSVGDVAVRLGLSALTSLEKQVVALKAHHPHTVLMFEVGYRYSLFGEDAAIAVSELSIWGFKKNNLFVASVPTHRLEVHLNRLLQAGYRVGVVSQVETAARKRAGLDGKRSGTFERAVTGVFTRGTFTPACDTDLVQESNHLVCVQEVGGGDGVAHVFLCALDTYANVLTWDEFDDGPLRTELHARLNALRPVEVVVPKGTGEGNDAGDGAEEVLLSHNTAAVVGHFASDADMGLEQRVDISPRARLVTQPLGMAGNLLLLLTEGITGQPVGAACLAGRVEALPMGVQATLDCLGRHLEALSGRSMAARLLALASVRRWASASRCTLGASTLTDLHIFADDRPKGTARDAPSLYEHLNRTKTPAGARLLATWLRSPLTSAAEIVDRLGAVRALVAALDAGATHESRGRRPRPFEPGAGVPLGGGGRRAGGDPELIRTPLQLLRAVAFAPCADVERGLLRAATARATVGEVYNLLKTLELALSAVVKGLDFEHQVVENSPLLRELLAAPAVRESDARLLGRVQDVLAGLCSEGIDSGDITDALVAAPDRHPQLQTAREHVKHVLQRLDAMLPEIRSLLSKRDLSYKTVLKEEYLIEVPVALVKSVPSTWQRVNATKTFVRFRCAASLPLASAETLRLTASGPHLYQAARGSKPP